MYRLRITIDVYDADTDTWNAVVEESERMQTREDLCRGLRGLAEDIDHGTQTLAPLAWEERA